VLLLAGIPVYVAMKWWQARRVPTAPVAVEELELVGSAP
jgi:hypothetical protein